jgi:Protein of unknown function (DUF2752)
MQTRETVIVRPDRLVRWLNQPRRTSARWLGKPCVMAAWLGLLLAVLSPPHGSGISLCWFQDATGLPCPGCGMTRSLSCAIRGMFLESWHYHPLGLFVLPLFVLIAAQSLMRRQLRDRLAKFVESRPVVFNGLYLAFVVIFMSFGLLRALLHFDSAWMASWL